MKKRKTKTFYSVVLFLISIGYDKVSAQPQGMQVVSGSATAADLSSLHRQIEVSDRTIISWESFSIGASETTTFVQPSSSSVVLNRVMGGVSSELLGSLNSNGQVFLINPSGIIIGEDACFQVGSLIASTLDILDDAFLQGKDIVFSGDSKASVVNLGTIRAPDGEVLLLGRFVDNQGIIDAKEAHLGAGSEIYLKMEGSDRIFIRPNTPFSGSNGVKNSGTIKALEASLQADGNAYRYAIQDSGVLEAEALKESGGRIYLVAEKGRIDLSGSYKAGLITAKAEKVFLIDEASMDASSLEEGGTIGIEANRIYVAKDVRLSADGKAGGDISLKANSANVCYGEISAKGEQGGTIELTSWGFFDVRGDVDASSESSNGNVSFLCKDFLVSSDSSLEVRMGSDIEIPKWIGYSGRFSPVFLQKILEGNHVTIVSPEGTISIQEDLSWDASMQGFLPSILYLEANQILIGVEGSRQANLTSQDPGHTGNAIVLEAETIQLGVQDRMKPSSLQAKSGDIAIVTNSLILQGGQNNNRVFADSSAKIQAGEGKISIDARGGKDLAIVLQGGIGKQSSSEISTIYGDILINSLQHAQEASLSMAGGSGENSHALIASLEAGSLSVSLPESSPVQLKGGSGTRSSFAMFSAGQKDGKGDVSITGGLVELVGGSGDLAGDVRAAIHARGSIDISAQEILMTGGNALGIDSDSRAALQTYEKGKMNLSLNNLALNGGSGDVSSAVIETVEGGSISLLSSRAGNFSMTGGSGEESFVGLLTSEGNITVSFPEGSSWNFQGGSSSGDSSVKIHSAHGNLSLKGGDVLLQGGQGEGECTVEINTEKGNIFVSTEGSVNLFAGDPSLASTAIYTSSGEVFIDSRGDIVLKATEESSSLFVSNGKHNINTSGSLVLEAPGKQRAYILNLSDEENEGRLSVRAKCNISLLGNSLLQNQADNLLVISGENLEMKEGRIENLGKGDLTLVVDHQFMTTNVAKGGLLLDKNSAIEGRGNVRIFTSERSLNSIKEVINGVYFVPHRKYLNSSQEKWGVAYPDDYFGDEGFMMFYRENGPCEVNEASVLYLAAVLNDQMYYQLFCSYDENRDLVLWFNTKYQEGVKQGYSIKRLRMFDWKEQLLPVGIP